MLQQLRGAVEIRADARCDPLLIRHARWRLRHLFEARQRRPQRADPPGELHAARGLRVQHEIAHPDRHVQEFPLERLGAAVQGCDVLEIGALGTRALTAPVEHRGSEQTQSGEQCPEAESQSLAERQIDAAPHHGSTL